jgi:ribosomal protein S18 acetylase RimI-like enzyme
VHAGSVAGLSIRPAREEDGDALVEVDRATWSTLTSPGPRPGPDAEFWSARTRPENALVAEREGGVVGYVKIEHPTELAASDHVWAITGLAVDPHVQGGGAGRALMEAVIDEARRRGGRRLTLRVFAANDRARRLYERLGFEVEGVLRGEFHVGGDYVDDVLMALDLRP